MVASGWVFPPMPGVPSDAENRSPREVLRNCGVAVEMLEKFEPRLLCSQLNLFSLPTPDALVRRLG
jgi:hypothetical protein